MQQNVKSQGQLEHRKKHKYWVALKAAYERYLSTSELAEAITAEEASRGNEPEWIRALEAQQKAFQQYIEARIEFLECHVDEARAPDASRTSVVGESLQPSEERPPWYGSLPGWIPKAVSYGLIAAVVCATTFSITEHMQVRTQKLARSVLNSQVPAY